MTESGKTRGPGNETGAGAEQRKALELVHWSDRQHTVRYIGREEGVGEPATLDERAA